MNNKLKQDGASQQGALKPEWIRPSDVPKIFGIGRTQLYSLLGEKKIKSASLKKRGQRHGTRLINVSSISAYLESLSEGGQ